MASSGWQEDDWGEEVSSLPSWPPAPFQRSMRHWTPAMLGDTSRPGWRIFPISHQSWLRAQHGVRAVPSRLGPAAGRLRPSGLAPPLTHESERLNLTKGQCPLAGCSFKVPAQGVARWLRGACGQALPHQQPANELSAPQIGSDMPLALCIEQMRCSISQAPLHAWLDAARETLNDLSRLAARRFSGPIRRRC